MTPQKIFILCFSGNRGGMELDAVRMARRVSEYADVTLIGMRGSVIEQMAIADQQAGARYHYIGSKVTRFLARALIDPKIALTVRRAVRTRQPDLVIFFGTSEVKSIGAGLIGLSAKLVLRIGTTVNKPKTGFFQQLAYRRVDGFLAISEHIRRNVFNSFPVASRRPIGLCFPVVDADTAAAAPDTTGPETSTPLRMVYHARFVPGKGQMDALVAFARIAGRFRQVSLVLVGSAQDEDYVLSLREFVQESGLDQRVRLLTDHQAVEPLLATSSIYLGPSHGEGFANSFVEALAAGLVCVVYDNTVFPGFKELGFEFFMVPDKDTVLLSEVLEKAILAVKEGLINTENNRRLVMSLFSKSAERACLERIYQAVSDKP